jgi:hypothetical protein
MLYLAIQIIVPLLIAALIGFFCAWALQRHATEAARAESEEARERLMKISAQLHTFRRMEGQMSRPSRQLVACKSELRMVDGELRRLLYDLMKGHR